MIMNFDRVDLIEKKLEVMGQEFSEVLAELQKTTQALARMVQIALRTLDERVTALESASKGNEIRKEEVGRDL
jgi:hypothetical protein